MSRFTPTILFALLFASAPHLNAQTSGPGSALNTLGNDVWQDALERSPEFASAIGDRRYNDKLTNLSPSAFNDAVARRSDFLARLLAINTTSLPAAQRAFADQLQRQLTEDAEAARFKAWEMPIAPSHPIQTGLPAAVADWPFSTVKDYDDYIARLHAIPAELRQASEDLLAGINDNRVDTAPVIQKAIADTEAIAAQKPDASPFAAPLMRFPAGIDAANRKRISADLLAAIQTDVLPAYTRFAKFLRVAVLPSPAQTEPPSPPPGYAIREQQILDLRHKAQAALGTKFNLQGFHDIVIDTGALPMEAVEQRVKAWIATQQ